MLRFDLHIHSSYSDGQDDVNQILKAAMKKKLDGISITDHDTLEGSFAAQRLVQEQNLDLIIIPGSEVTTSEGHLLAIGIEDLPPLKKSPEKTIDAIHELGGIAIASHPFHLFRHAMFRIPNCDAVEVYNSKHLFGIANAWARREAQKRGLPMTAGSDAHMAETVGLGVTEIDAQDVDGVLDAICAGRTRITGQKKTSPKVFVVQMARWVRRHICMRK
ncbi:MAG: CehA/McbA family metallohydrolase [Methanotrichaceae archaeon]